MPNGNSIQACRNKLAGLGANGAHAGAVLSHCLQKQNDDNNAARRAVLDQASAATIRARAVYALAFERWRAGYPVHRTVETEGRLIAGLGGQSTLETGITLHHTYGTPVIPGTSLKGLASHYCEEVWGVTDARFKKGDKFHHEIFGDQDDAGFVTFHDAWIAPESLKKDSGLVLDVMTPHHREYYGKAGPPTDFDDPNPVSFLSVTGRFLLIVSCGGITPDANSKRWAELALELLLAAAADWGVGGKTNSGYGRLRGV